MLRSEGEGTELREVRFDPSWTGIEQKLLTVPEGKVAKIVMIKATNPPSMDRIAVFELRDDYRYFKSEYY